MMKCPVCGSERLRSLGVDEDVEMWRCLECGEAFDTDDDLVAEVQLELDAAAMDDLYADYPPDDPDDLARRRNG